MPAQHHQRCRIMVDVTAIIVTTILTGCGTEKTQSTVDHRAGAEGEAGAPDTAAVPSPKGGLAVGGRLLSETVLPAGTVVADPLAMSSRASGTTTSIDYGSGAAPTATSTSLGTAPTATSTSLRTAPTATATSLGTAPTATSAITGVVPDGGVDPSSGTAPAACKPTDEFGISCWLGDHPEFMAYYQAQGMASDDGTAPILALGAGIQPFTRLLPGDVIPACGFVALDIIRWNRLALPYCARQGLLPNYPPAVSFSFCIERSGSVVLYSAPAGYFANQDDCDEATAT